MSVLSRRRETVSGDSVFLSALYLTYAMRADPCVLRSVHVCLAISIGVFYVRFTPVFFLPEEKETACGMLHFYSAVGRDRRYCVLESSVRLSDFVGSL